MTIDAVIVNACYERAIAFSPCKKFKVGAVIVPTIKGESKWSECAENIGVNWREREKEAGWLPKCETFLALRCGKECPCGKARHAEVDAILRYKREFWYLGDTDFLTLYTTHYPCAKCLNAALSIGVTRLVIGHSTPNDEADSAALYQAMEEGLLEEVRFV